MSDHGNHQTPWKDSPLSDRLREIIAAGGPMTIAQYWAHCLYDPEFGYYIKHQPLGREGDFTTAPEISQIFGELIGIWCIKMWTELGCPASYNLVEIGPGRGTLMVDLLRAAKISEGFLAAANIHLVEVNPVLQTLQQQNLKASRKPVTWHQNLDDLPAGPIILIGNEFLDCLPIHQFVKTPDGWRERMVGTNEDRLVFTLGPGMHAREQLSKEQLDAPKDAVIETSPARNAFIQNLASCLRDHEGAALFIDYGHAIPGISDTLQALYRQQMSDPLHHPGDSDLTSHVDFASIAVAARDAGASASPILTQGEFLLSMGLLQRAGMLGHGRSQKEQQHIQSAVERLASPDHMGQLFKAICIHSSNSSLAPFDFDV